MTRKLKIHLSDSYIIAMSQLKKHEMVMLRREFSRKNPTYFKLRSLGFSTRGTKPHINLYEIRSRNICFPRGSLKTLKELLDDYKLVVIDERVESPLNKKIEFKEDFKLWTSQEEAKDKAISEEQGLIHAVCASGKTEMLLGIFAELGQRTLVIVDKIKLMNQWVERVKKHFKNVEVKTIGAGKWGIGDITIGSQKTLVRHVSKLKDKFGVVLCDEVHHYAARTFQELISQLPAKYRIGATATLKRKDQKQFLVFAAFGEVLHKITDDELSKQGKIFEIEMVVVPTDFESKLYISTRIDEATGKEEIVRYDYNGMLREMKLCVKRNKQILDLIEREIGDKHKCLVMADRIAQCIFIQRLLEKRGVRANLMVGEKEFEKQTREAPEKLKQGKISCIVASPLIQEGFDLPELDRGFIISPSVSNPSKLQQQAGRIKRMAEGKESAKVYYFWDRKVHGFGSHLKKIQRLYRNTRVYVKRKRRSLN